MSRFFGAALALVSLTISAPAQIILEDDFDDPEASGWVGQGNSRTFSSQTLSQSGSVLTSEVVATQSNVNRGIVSEASFVPAATGGFRITFVATDVSTAPAANGYFIGIVRDDDVFHRDASTANFGLAFFGLDARTGSGGGFGLVYGDNNGVGAATHLLADSDSAGDVQPTSFSDGFTASIEVDPGGWSYEITGLLTAAGAAAPFQGDGDWADAGASFEALWPAGEPWFVTAANQVLDTGTHQIAFDRISVEQVEPPIDTDGDGMPDAYEMANGTDIDTDDAATDSDGDGLTNLQEFLGQDADDTAHGYGRTLSGTADTDGDDIDDNDEITGALNPWSAGMLAAPPGDSTNPNNANSDGEGADDGTEILNGTDPNAAPPNTGPLFPFVDSDGDSYSDSAETAFGSDPADRDSCPDHTPGATKPNVVIIYADDLGFGDISAYGDLFGTPSPTVTPHVDALVAQGVMFTQAHSSNGVCTPSRYALLTGKYNWREFNGITNHYGGQMGGQEVPRPSDVTIAEFLRTHAYDTAAFGKWHLGGAFYTRAGARVTGNPNTPNNIDWARPVEHHAVANGFDVFRGLAATINRGPYVYLHDDRIQYWDTALNAGAGGYRDATNVDTFHWFTSAELSSTVVGIKASTPSLGDPSYTQVGAGPQMISQVEQYIAERATSGDPDPFFAYVSLYSPHFPQAITPPFVGSVGFHSGDFIREVDHRIGRVINALDNNGFGDNTVIVFTSDNGPENGAMTESLNNGTDPNGPLRGNKRDVWDGGTRVPFIVRWPGQAAPGLVSNGLVWQGDIFATLAAYLGADLPRTTAPDGESFLNLLHGQQKPEPRRPSIVVSSIRGDLALKTIDGWKFVDSSGGGHNTSWDSNNQSIPGAAGTNRGTPKQLFRQSLDLGEDNNLIEGVTDIATIRSVGTDLVGIDLLGELDAYRTATTASRFLREPDNDADGMSNRFERGFGLDPNLRKDAWDDLDGDGVNNIDERIAGSDLNDPTETYRILNVEDRSDRLTVSWFSDDSRSYEVFWSEDLVGWHLYSTHGGSDGQLGANLDKATIDASDGIIGNLSRIYVRVSATEDR